MAELKVKVEFNEEQFCSMIERFKSEHPDFVEVLRCKDCRYWNTEDWRFLGGVPKTDEGMRYARCQIHNHYDPISKTHTGWCPTENDFCSCGERKDGDG